MKTSMFCWPLASKKRFFTFLIILSCITMFGQQNKTDQQDTKSELFSSKSGRLLQKEFVSIGKMNGCEFNVLHMTDLNSGEKIGALRIEMTSTSQYANSTYIAALDADEIDGLIKSLNKIKAVITTSPQNYTEVSFTSRGGFEVGAFYNTEKSKWDLYMKLEKFSNSSMVFMKAGDIDTLISLIEKSQVELSK